VQDLLQVLQKFASICSMTKEYFLVGHYAIFISTPKYKSIENLNEIKATTQLCVYISI